MKSAKVYGLGVAFGIVAILLAVFLLKHPGAGGTRDRSAASLDATKAPRGVRWMHPADDPAPLPAAGGDAEKAAVRGRVVDGLTGAPVGGAEVTLRGRDGAILDEAIAKDDGSFGFGSLAGAEMVASRAVGYAFFTESLHLRVGLDPADLELSLDPAVRVSGRVLDLKGAAVAGATVWVEDDEGTDWERWPRPASDQVTTGPDGRFSVDDAPSGSLIVRAKADGFAEGELELKGVGPGREKKDVIVKLGDRPVIAGRVLDGDGTPVAGAEVVFRAWGPDGDETAPVISGADGGFRIEAHAESNGAVVAHEGSRAGAAAAQAPSDHPVEVRLGPTHALTGRVLDGAGAPIAHARVRILQDDRTVGAVLGSSFRAETDAEGRFSLDRVRAGAVQLLASADGYADGTAVVEQEKTVEIRLSAGESLSGSVVTSDGRPLSAAGRVVATTRNFRPKSVQAPVTDGRFETKLGPGDWKLVAEAKGFASSDPVEISLTGESAPSPVTLTLAAIGTVRGRLVSRDGGVIAGARVSVSGQPPWAPMPHEENARLDWNSEVRTGPDGRFELPAKAGERKLFVYHPEFRPDLVRVDVPAGGTLDVGDVELLPGPSSSAIFEFSGIGAVISNDEGGCTVRGVLPDSPAQRAGILEKDVFVEVDGEPTAGKDLGDIIAHIRGPVGTAVSLTVARAGNPETLHFDVVREKIRGPS